jgi:uncharacterized RDD family membrane protein YckC
MVLLFGDIDTVETTTTGDGIRTENTQFHFNLGGAAFGAYLAIVFVYYTVFEAITRTTPGKFLMSLRIVSLNAHDLTVGRIVVRNILRIVDFLPVLYLVGLITVAASRSNQRIGDMAAGTGVAATDEPVAVNA